MKKIRQISQIILIAILLSSCKTSIKEEYPIIKEGENTNKNNKSEKKKMEIKFSCGEDGISKYLDNGWIILKEDSQENLYLNLFQLLKIVIWKKIKVVG